jgi:hypothetical protein
MIMFGMETPDPGLARRYARFFREAMAGHRVGLVRSVHVCQCGVIPALCAVHAAAVRNGLVDHTNLAWQPNPKDIPAPPRPSGERSEPERRSQPTAPHPTAPCSRRRCRGGSDGGSPS